MAEEIIVVPHYQGSQGSPFGIETVKTARLHVPDQVLANRIEGGARRFDIGVIELTQDLGRRAGMLTVKSYNDTQLDLVEAWIAGYPVELPPSGTTQVFWRHSGRIRDSDADLVRYVIDTSPGQSGAPVLALPANAPGRGEVFAVHTYGTSVGNEGVRITPVWETWISRWNTTIPGP